MEIFITGLNRSTTTTCVDRDVVAEFGVTNEYLIDFSIYSDRSVMDSSIDIRYDGDLTFAKAKEIVEAKLNIRE